MNPKPTRLTAFAELGRVSNLPTIITNVMVGCAIDDVDFTPEWIPLLATSAAVGLLYIGGMAMNDLFDESFDRVHSPQRPLPSGRISRSAASGFMAATLLSGLGILAWLGGLTLALGLLLVALITAYNGLHRKFGWAFLFMGGCRASVYAVAASTIFPSLPAWFLVGFGSAIFLYTSTITLIARQEHEDRIGKRRLLAFAMPIFLLYPTLFASYFNVGLILAAGLIGAVWMVRGVRFVWDNPPKTKSAILTWLSGMCLLDAYFLALLNQPILVGLAVGCFALTHWGHRRISGT